MTASAYVLGQGLRWTVEAAIAGMSERDHTRLPDVIETARAAFACDEGWLANRLTVLWLSAGYRKGEAQAIAWLGETIRLLKHVPADILATAIDEAVMRSERGFLPAVGEILKLAEPALAKRREALRRLEAIDVAIAAPPAAAIAEAPLERCSPDEAAAIMAEYGIERDTTAGAIVATAAAAGSEAR